MQAGLVVSLSNKDQPRETLAPRMPEPERVRCRLLHQQIQIALSGGEIAAPQRHRTGPLAENVAEGKHVPDRSGLLHGIFNDAQCLVREPEQPEATRLKR